MYEILQSSITTAASLAARAPPQLRGKMAAEADDAPVRAGAPPLSFDQLLSRELKVRMQRA